MRICRLKWPRCGRSGTNMGNVNVKNPRKKPIVGAKFESKKGPTKKGV